MAEFEIVAVLTTDKDVDAFCDGKDLPEPRKRKRVRYCECGAELAKGRHKCSECVVKRMSKAKREYMRQYRAKKGRAS